MQKVTKYMGYMGLGMAMMTAAMVATPAPADITISIRHSGIDDGPVVTKDLNPWLDLGDDESAVVVDGDRTDHIQGPFHGRLKQARKSGGANLDFHDSVNRIKTEAAVHAARVAKSGGESGLPLGLTLTDINIESTDKQCTLAQPGRLWRAHAEKPAEIIIAFIGGHAQKVLFKRGENFAHWPSGVAISTDDSEYVVLQPDSDVVTRKLSLVRLNADTNGQVNVDRLVEKGCLSQARIAAEIKLTPEK